MRDAAARALGIAAVLVLVLAACGDDATGPGASGPAVAIVGAPTSARQGDVVGFSAEVTGEDGTPLGDEVTWSVAPLDAGFISPSGRFVGYEPGTVRVIASSGGGADTSVVTITARGLSGSFQEVGRGVVSRRFTSDLWLAGDHAYTGTWGSRDVAGVTLRGNRLYAWSVADPANPALTDSVAVDAFTVNDVKVREDGLLAVITHEGSVDGLDGITLLDLSDPAHPAVITRFTDGAVQFGVHNVWIDGDFVYAAAGDGSVRVIDVSQPSTPLQVAGFQADSSFVHDVYVRDGLAFVSHWDAGLVILDVGNGVRGGSPGQPVEVSSLVLDGETHNAWYWPERGYVFVGEEDGEPPYGVLHVVDVSDLTDPREVATFRVPGSEPHNFWVDEERAILYAAWYSEGLRALDVGGELLGALDRQGREIAFSLYNGSGDCPESASTATCTWAPQLHRGLVWVSDMNRGLVALEPTF